jgi:hypothetical protein
LLNAGSACAVKDAGNIRNAAQSRRDFFTERFWIN